MNIFFAFSYSSIFKNINFFNTFLLCSCQSSCSLSTDKLLSKNASVNRQPNYITTFGGIKSSIFFKFFWFFLLFFIFDKIALNIHSIGNLLYNIERARETRARLTILTATAAGFTISWAFFARLTRRRIHFPRIIPRGNLPAIGAFYFI